MALPKIKSHSKPKSPKVVTLKNRVTLRACPFFRDFPNEILDQIMKYSKNLQLNRGEVLLREGVPNQTLYFLLQGHLGVYVRGEHVANIENVGEVVGEMSVVTTKPASASVVALTDAEVLAIESASFSDLAVREEDLFKLSLYRIFCLILSERLEQTNEKAHQYEVTNRQLKQAQEALQDANTQLERNIHERTLALQRKTEELTKSHIELEKSHTAVLASYRKLKDLSFMKKSIFKKLSNLYRNHLSGLEINLNKIIQTGVPEVRDKVTHATHALQIVMEEISALTSIYSTELAMKSKRVLLLETESRQQIIAKMALGGTGVKLDIANDFAEGERYLNKFQYDVVCTCSDLVGLSKIATEKSKNVRIVFMTSDDVATYLNHLKAHPELTSVVARNEDDRLFTTKNISTTVSKIISQDFFGLEKYLSWGVEVKEFAVRSSRQRKELVEEMSAYFKGVGLRHSILERCNTVAEELLMNAIYDAATRSDGTPIYNHLSRRVPVELKSEEQGLFRFACDGSVVAVSVQDPFGALKRETILDYLAGCYGGKAGTLNDKVAKGGAGMGLFQLLGTSDLLIFNVQPKVKTEVIALFNADPSKARTVTCPSFHMFFTD